MKIIPSIHLKPVQVLLKNLDNFFLKTKASITDAFLFTPNLGCSKEGSFLDCMKG
jgi:hypothetical protein